MASRVLFALRRVHVPRSSHTRGVHNIAAENGSTSPPAAPLPMYDMEGVTIVRTVAQARAVIALVAKLPRSTVHAWDTEVVDIDLDTQSPVGHGRVICASFFSGPDVDYGAGPRVWIDALPGPGEGGEVLRAFKPLLEDEGVRKVWHNYGFDRHVLGNSGIDVRGFHGDTMHLARLHSTGRDKAGLGGYSLAALSKAFVVSKGIAEGKRSMLDLFGRPRKKKNGEDSKIRELPALDEVQRSVDADIFRLWVKYSTLDAELTWHLFQTLKAELSDPKTAAWRPAPVCFSDVQFDSINALDLQPGQRDTEGEPPVLYELYARVLRPFGELLTSMERHGITVNQASITAAGKAAEAERVAVIARFQAWATSFSGQPDMRFLNVHSDMQKAAFLFGLPVAVEAPVGASAEGGGESWDGMGRAGGLDTPALVPVADVPPPVGAGASEVSKAAPVKKPRKSSAAPAAAAPPQLQAPPPVEQSPVEVAAPRLRRWTKTAAPAPDAPVEGSGVAPGAGGGAPAGGRTFAWRRVVLAPPSPLLHALVRAVAVRFASFSGLGRRWASSFSAGMSRSPATPRHSGGYGSDADGDWGGGGFIGLGDAPSDSEVALSLNESEFEEWSSEEEVGGEGSSRSEEDSDGEGAAAAPAVPHFTTSSGLPRGGYVPPPLRPSDRVSEAHEFETENVEGFVEPGKAKAKKKKTFLVTSLRLPIAERTPKGRASATAGAISKVLGKPVEGGLAYSHLVAHGCEPAAAKEACARIGDLNTISAIDTVIETFLLPLQLASAASPVSRVHCSLNLNTETGRLSARRPNLQNQPSLERDRFKIRSAFVAPPGSCFIVADYGQLELRVLAHLTNCASMIGSFKAGGDFHSRTALGMYPHVRAAVEAGTVVLEWPEGAGPSPVPMLKDAYKEERRKAKILNFSIAYGKTAFGLAKDWGVSVKEAEATVAAWYGDRPEVEAWQAETKANARRTGRVYTMLGRHRDLHGINSRRTAAHAERAAINTPIQGSAADIVMCAMLKIWRDPILAGWGYKMLLQVHDEVILEGPIEHGSAARARVVEVRERTLALDFFGPSHSLRKPSPAAHGRALRPPARRGPGRGREGRDLVGAGQVGGTTNWDYVRARRGEGGTTGTTPSTWACGGARGQRTPTGGSGAARACSLTHSFSGRSATCNGSAANRYCIASLPIVLTCRGTSHRATGAPKSSCASFLGASYRPERPPPRKERVTCCVPVRQDAK